MKSSLKVGNYAILNLLNNINILILNFSMKSIIDY